MRGSALRGLINGLALLLIGCGIGWFVGLSVSPVVHVLVASIVTAAAGVAVTLSETKWSREFTSDTWKPGSLQDQVTAVPLALVVIGAMAGSTLGIYARTHNWFGNPLTVKIEKFADESRGVLFSGEGPSECIELKAAMSRGELRRAMNNSSNEHIRAFVTGVTDDASLGIALKELVCPEKATGH